MCVCVFYLRPYVGVVCGLDATKEFHQHGFISLTVVMNTGLSHEGGAPAVWRHVPFSQNICTDKIYVCNYGVCVYRGTSFRTWDLSSCLPWWARLFPPSLWEEAWWDCPRWASSTSSPSSKGKKRRGMMWEK